MGIKSLTFILFVLGVIIIYYLLQNTKFQKYFLLMASVVCVTCMTNLYGTFMIVLLALTVYLIAGKMESLIRKNDGRIDGKVRMLFWLGVLFDIGLLLYFKFFKSTYYLLQEVLEARSISVPDLVVPIGLAYYSLALYGYLWDIYHKKYEAEKHFLLFLSYVMYFPAIIEGPVNLYKKLMPQLKKQHSFHEQTVMMGLQRSLWGYFKKMVIADRIGILVNGILQDEAAVGPILFYALVLYSFQIYTDFSGGIDIVMGISEALDIKLTENFRAPLVSKSVTEYWQRWHISLGEFMEKYIYYPIVLNRKVMKFSKKIPVKYLSRAFSATIASVIVFTLVGIWHGTGWNYVVYGMYQAFFVASAILMAPVYKKVREVLRFDEKTVGFQLFAAIRTFIILTFGRMLIKAPDLSSAIGLLKKMFADLNPHALFDGSIYGYELDVKNVYLIYFCILLILVIDICHEKGIHFRQILMKQNIVFRYAVYYAAVFSIIIFGIYGTKFNVSDFIYMGF